MKKIFLLISLSLCLTIHLNAQHSASYESGYRLNASLDYDILLIAQDCTAYDNIAKKAGQVKGSFASPVYIPSDNTIGYIVVGNEENKNDNIFLNASDVPQDGGGITQFKISRSADDKWSISPQTVDGKPRNYRNVNTTAVGGTIFNSGLTTTIKNKILITEDWLQMSNAQLKKSDTAASTPNNSGIRSTTNFTIPAGTGIAAGKNVQRYKNMNWVMEMDPATAKITKKHYTMGRFGHADCMVWDENTIYLTSSTPPYVLFKFESDAINNYSAGTLYFYKQENNDFEKWVSLSKETASGSGVYVQDFDTLQVAQEEALKRGATMFSNLAGMAIINDYYLEDVLLIAEKGMDDSGDMYVNPLKKFNGNLANHLIEVDGRDGATDNVLHDVYGRILLLDPANFINVYMECGPAVNGQNAENKYVLSNPDKLGVISTTGVNGKKYLVVHEDVNGLSQGRNADTIFSMEDVINEVYLLDAQNLYDDGNVIVPVPPTVDNMKRYITGPKGAKIAGGSFDNQNSTYFISIQNPNPGNEHPWNKSMVIALKGMDEYFLAPTNDTPTDIINPVNSLNDNFQIWPNPAYDRFFINKISDIEIYNLQGVLIKSEKQSNQIDISDIQPGMYIVRSLEGISKKLIKH